MSEHLPECEWNDATRVNRHCICPALRACEQRIDKAWHEYDQLAREGAYLSGVQAARDAVAALPHEDGCCSKGCACRTWDKQEPCDLSCNCSFWWMPHALAAIDALRGES